MKKKLLKISILLLSIIMLCNMCFAAPDKTKAVVSSNPNAVKAPVLSGNPMVDVGNEVFGTKKEDLTPEEIELYYGDEADRINVKKGDVYLADQEVTVDDQYIDGNVFITGEKVTVNAGVIDGNLFVMAEDTEINSEVRGSIYVLAQNVKISSRTKDVYVAGEKIELTKESYVIRDVRLFASEVKLNGRVNNNAYSAATKTIIDDETLTARIIGELHYTGELSKLDNISIGSVIKDESMVNVEEIENEANTAIEAASSSINTIGIFMGISCGAALIIIAGLLFKSPIANLIPEGKNGYALAIVEALKGLGLMIIIPIALVVILFTIVGIPISLVGFLVYLLLILASVPVASLVIVRTFLADKVKGNGLQILVAILLYTVLIGISYIPVLGTIVNTLVMWYGFYKLLTVGQRYSKVPTAVDNDPIVIEK